jgi:eukaryotic-like serine/threonine-protein kinase
VLARARVAGTLFGAQATSGLGRFRVLDRLGAGGMGGLHAAYDPDLDRGGALKLLPVPAGGREVALAEAKALARLSHPNVVPIYDVGIAGAPEVVLLEIRSGNTLIRLFLPPPERQV